MKYGIKTIKEFPNYKVNTLGQVWNILNNKKLKGKIDKDGYIVINLTKNGVKKSRLIHRLVAQAFLNNPSNLPLVCHNNSKESDNRIENLRWDNQQGNMVDRDNSGEKNPAATLSKIQVAKIKNIYSEKELSQEEIGNLFNVKQVTISAIVNGRTWKGVGY